MPRLCELDKGGNTLTGKDAALSEYLKQLEATDAGGSLSFHDMAFVHLWGWLLDPETVRNMTKLVAGITTGSKRRRAESTGPSTRAAKAGPKADDAPWTVHSLFG